MGEWYLIKVEKINAVFQHVYWGVRYPNSANPSRGLCNKYVMPIGVTQVDHYRTLKIDCWAIDVYDNSHAGEWVESV
jgi:hypothetical protein